MADGWIATRNCALHCFFAAIQEGAPGEGESDDQVISRRPSIRTVSRYREEVLLRQGLGGPKFVVYASGYLPRSQKRTSLTSLGSVAPRRHDGDEQLLVAQ